MMKVYDILHCVNYTYVHLPTEKVFLQVLIYNQLLINKIPLPCVALQIHRQTVTDKSYLTGNALLEHKWNGNTK